MGRAAGELCNWGATESPLLIAIGRTVLPTASGEHAEVLSLWAAFNSLVATAMREVAIEAQFLAVGNCAHAPQNQLDSCCESSPRLLSCFAASFLSLVVRTPCVSVRLGVVGTGVCC